MKIDNKIYFPTVIIGLIFMFSGVAFADVELYKRIDLSDNSVENCRASIGDLTGNGEIDFVFNDGRRIIKAFDHQGNLLWQKINKNDPGVGEEYHNFTIQNYDIDLDGRDEVICFLEINSENHLAVIDGVTGTIQTSVKVPFEAPRDHEFWGLKNLYMQDHIAIANLRGQEIPQDILAIHASKLKVAAYTYRDNKLDFQWYFVTDENETGYSSGHWAYPYDIDDDGKDEVLAGVDVLSETGEFLWRMDVGPFNPNHPNWGMDHVDALVCADIHPGHPGKEIIVGASVGLWLYTPDGTVMWHHPSKWVDPEKGMFGAIGEEGAQEVLVGNFKPDTPGLEIVVFEESMGGSQSVAMFDKDGNVLKWGDQGPGPRRWITYNIDWDGDRSQDEIYSRTGIYDDDFNFLSYTMNWGLLHTDDEGEEFYPIVCDVQGDHREEILWYDNDELLILENKDPLTGEVKPSPRNSLAYRVRMANNNHCNAMYFDWQHFTDVTVAQKDDGLNAAIEYERSKSDAHLYTIRMITSKKVSQIPSALILKESDNSVTEVHFNKSLSNQIFAGTLLVDENVSSGWGEFSLPAGSLINEEGVEGTSEITNGKMIFIDKNPPSDPGTARIF